MKPTTSGISDTFIHKLRMLFSEVVRCVSVVVCSAITTSVTSWR